jgi:hypothetical protein
MHFHSSDAMLTVQASASTPGVATVRLGGYVPLEIEWETSSSDPPLYWRTGDFRLSLVEAGFDPRTGVLRSFSLVLAEAIVPVEVASEEVPAADSEELPVCDPGTWLQRTRTGSIRTQGDRFIDEAAPVVAEVGATVFRVRFAEPDGRWGRVLAAGRVRFWITAQNGLGMVEVTGLTAEERLALVEYGARLASDRARGRRHAPGAGSEGQPRH